MRGPPPSRPPLLPNSNSALRHACGVSYPRRMAEADAVAAVGLLSHFLPLRYCSRYPRSRRRPRRWVSIQ